MALTIDCPTVEVQQRLLRFYATALGGEVVAGSVRARGWLFVFEVIPDYRAPTWPDGDTPKQMHFEWMVEDLGSAVATLQGLGATFAEFQRPGDDSVRVMLDPAGHPFCVATAAGASEPFRDEATRQRR